MNLSQLATTLTHPDNLTVTVLSVAILLVALLGYWLWFSPITQSTIGGLHALINALRSSANQWDDACQKARAASKRHPSLALAWEETERRVIHIPLGDRRQAVTFGPPADIWNAQSLVAQRVNLPLAEAIPNILVGIGLLLTFFFLVLALTQTTAALDQVSSPQDTEAAIGELLKIAGAKFLTSLAGLAASIAWTIALRRTLNRAERACRKLLQELDHLAPSFGHEMLIQQQLTTITRQGQQADDHNALLEELLTEARESTGTLKRFETDWIIALGRQLDQTFGVQMNAMTDKLLSAIGGLSDRLGTLNQEALTKMANDFGVTLTSSTKNEMAGLQAALAQVSTRLEQAGDAFDARARNASEVLDQTGASLVAHVQAATQNMSASAASLDTAAVTLKTSMDGLDASLGKLARTTDEGANHLNAVAEKIAIVLGRTEKLASGLQDAAGSVQAAITTLDHAMKGAAELSVEQHRVIEAVQHVAPAAMAAVDKITSSMSMAAERSHATVEKTGRALESTAGMLANTVITLEEGVKNYTDQIAELHLTMDSALAKAVGQFDQMIHELDDTTQELIDTLAVYRQRTQ